MSDGRRGRSLTEDEDALWRGVARSVKPLRARPPKRVTEVVAPPAPVKAKPKIRSSRSPVCRLCMRAIPAPAPSIPSPDTDRPPHRKRLRAATGRSTRGSTCMAMTQAEAHAALSRFLHRVQADGAKFVIVVTGKGGRGNSEHGVLRRQVPCMAASAGVSQRGCRL